MGLNMILPLVGGLAVFGVLASVVLVKKRTAYLGPVKEELQKEKMWLRRGEYNAAMVKGRQNLELLLKLVAEKNGIQLDNTAQAVANAREEEERQSQKRQGKHGGRKKEKKVMTHHQFNRWLAENGYLDRVAKWEMNQVRLIGNKAVHENYADKDDAWNQYNYLEDILKTVTEKSQNPKKHHERKASEKQPEKVERHQGEKKRQDGQKDVKKATVEKASKLAKTEASAAKPMSSEGALTEEHAEHKKRRRRRRKKPNVPTETKVLVKETPVAADVTEKKRSEKKQPEKKQPEKKQTEKKQPEKASKPVKAETSEAKPMSTEGALTEEHAEHKKRRRRRRKKPNVPTETKVLVKETPVAADVTEKKRSEKKRPEKKQPEKKQTEKKQPEKASKPVKAETSEAKPTSTEETAAGEHAEHKKRRRRRRRKPQSKPADGATVTANVPEDRNETI